jgi:hypothetical protein
MGSATNASVEYEQQQVPYGMSALEAATDNKTFTSFTNIWSMRSGYAPDVRPNGVINGFEITPAASGADDKVDVAAGQCYLAGVLTDVAAALDVTVGRGLTTDTHRITSITITSLGAVAAITGTDATAFSESRGDDGAPPYIPVGSIELGQVRLTSVTAGPVTALEVFQTVGVHQERYDSPLWTEEPERGRVVFDSALPAIHTGDVPKKVYASYAGVTFRELSNGSNFVAPEVSYSVSATQVYQRIVAATSSSLSAGSFTALLKDGISDHIVGLKGERLWFRFKSDKNRVPYILANGTMGLTRTFPAGANISGNFTIASETESFDRATG